MSMWKAAAAGIVFSLIAAALKQVREDFRQYLLLGAAVYFGYLVLDRIIYFAGSLKELQNYLSVNEAYMESILKMLGITCIGEFASDFCRDSGHEALSRQISMIARLTILSFSMPIVLAIMRSVWQLTG